MRTRNLNVGDKVRVVDPLTARKPCAIVRHHQLKGTEGLISRIYPDNGPQTVWKRYTVEFPAGLKVVIPIDEIELIKEETPLES